jgi:hypothetical protein
MSQRAEKLHTTADGQIAALIALVSSLDAGASRLPCPGREKLGDGTVGACMQFTAHNYERIAAFVQAEHDHVTGSHPDHYAADDVDLEALLEQLSATRDALGRVAELTDQQLDTIPPSGSFRFCDGQRTLEEVLAGLLKHQSHQVDAVRAATVQGLRPR